MKRQFCFFIALIFILSSAFCVSAATVPPAAGKVTTETAHLNVRAAASADSAIRAKLDPGQWVTILSEHGSWYLVQYAAKETGYVSAAYLKPKAGSRFAYVNTGSSNLNVRRNGSTDAQIKASLPHGSRVAIIEEANGWATILFDGTRKGYVASRYLSASAADPKQPALNVPYYLQTDSRWKNIRIGNSGGTIGTIGCTTTCLAMAESYRTGTTITPDIMARRLSYSSGGSLYWPSNYTAALAGSDYLTQIRTLLDSGKPVVFGAKKANGTQHWVVVTGYTGTAKAAFSIHDPATRNRTTLADFLAVYPNVYKIAHYN